MNLEQAQKIRQELLYLEGIIARETTEYIWKVLVGPQDRQKLERFRKSFDPALPFDPLGMIRPYLKDELSVYFFLKKEGHIICRRYEEFLSANHIQAGEKKLPASGSHPEAGKLIFTIRENSTG
jgi:hypothetical protein